MASSTLTRPQVIGEARLLGRSGEAQALGWLLPPSLEQAAGEAVRRLGFGLCAVSTLADLRDALFDQQVSVALVYFGRDLGQGEAGCRAIRKHPLGGEVPIVALLDERLACSFPLEYAPDELAIEPASAAEIALRVRVALWRRDRPGREGLVKVGDMVVDERAMRVRLHGAPVDLTYKEFALLNYLVRNRGVALRRSQILEAVWGEDYYGGDRTVDIHIRRLRAKLPPLAVLITTVHGVGYRLEKSDTR